MFLLRSDAARVMAAVAVANGSPRLSALKESPFLPSVSGEVERSSEGSQTRVLTGEPWR
jgi:hypothetical protein